MLKRSRVLAFWCFDPGLGFSKLRELNPRSIILTSGTLSPMDSTASELKNPFPIRIECPHVVDKQQVLVQVLQKGPDNCVFNFNYQNRRNKDQMNDLGAAIGNCSRMVEGGILVFFSSYEVLNSFFNHWEENGTIDRLRENKDVFRESKNARTAKKVMKAYYDAIRLNRGAVLFAVCRGKISEGLNFEDSLGRMVIVVGVPYPSLVSHRTNLKKNYLDRQFGFRADTSEGFRKINGREWYQQQAIRAVNQAIGRVIRHAQDYGTILLVDERYSYSNNRS